MAEVSKSRLALDLEEIERQLRHSSQQPGSSRSDPLAELARIVGQEDPFRTLLASEPKRRAGKGEDVFGRREPIFDDNGYGGNGLRGSLTDDEATPFHAYHDYQAHGLALTAEEETLLRGQDDPRYASAQEAELYFQDGPSYAEPESTFAPVEPRRSRKGLIAVGAVFGAAVIGVAGVMLSRSGPVGLAGGEPPFVQADAGPSKVAPQHPGGVDIPNQNRQIWERPAPDGQTRVVNREEQPVDVRQATRTTSGISEGASDSNGVRLSPSLPPSAGIPASLQGTSNAAAGILGEPRRVRTVSIRPDGTIIAQDPSAPSRPASAPIPSQPVAAPRAEASSTADATPSPASPARTLPVQRPRDVTATPSAPRFAAGTEPGIGAPLQITSEPYRPRSEARVAAVPPTTVREPTETSAAPTASAGFTVQLGVRNTEREARAVFEQLQQRFSGDLTGFSPLIRQAEINGKPAYRLRVGPMSRNDAASLCTRLKAAGGQCFVANN